MSVRRGCLLLFVCASCGAAGPRAASLPSSPLVRPDGETVNTRALVAGSPFTVMIFFSTHCHCLDQHEDRLKALHEQYGPRGVQFIMIDSEVGASPERDRAEALRRGYPFPILDDRSARLADGLHAEYATFSVVVDREGRVVYRGGIDTDKTHLRDDATPYLRDAIDDVLAGRPPRIAEGKTLGCALEKW